MLNNSDIHSSGQSKNFTENRTQLWYNIFISPNPRELTIIRFWEEPKMIIRKSRKSLIRGWRHKLIFLLVIYFAGFATAVYCLAPAPQNADNRTDDNSFAYSVLKSDEFAMAFNEGLHKIIDFSKSAALHTADFIKQEYNQRRAQSNG